MANIKNPTHVKTVIKITRPVDQMSAWWGFSVVVLGVVIEVVTLAGSVVLDDAIVVDAVVDDAIG